MIAYLYYIKIKILTSLAYRFSLLAILVTQSVQLIVGVYFWRAAYADNTIMKGVTLQQMLLYNFVTVILSCLYVQSIEGNVRARIRQGDIAVDFIKPINIFGIYFAQDVGQVVVNIAQRFAPIIIITLIIGINPLPLNLTAFLLFLPSVVMGYLIIWLTFAMFGLLYFWLIDLGPLGMTMNYIIMILSGSLIPIWFFPETVQRVLNFLPFIYIYQVPIGIYIGRTSPMDARWQLLFQLFWCCMFLFCFILIQKKVRGKLMVQGG